MNKYITLVFVTFLLFTAITPAVAQNPPANTPPPPSKFTDIIQLSLNDIDIGSGTESGLVTGFGDIFAYKPVHYFSAGVGAGFESNTGYTNSSYIPVSADFRLYFNQSQAAPFLNLNGGYAFEISKARRMKKGGDGVFIGLNYGVKITITNNINLQFAVGIKYEYYTEQFSDGKLGSYNNDVYVPFSLGLEF